MNHIRLFAVVLISVLVAFLEGGLSSELGVGMDAKTLKPVNTTDLANRAKYAAMNTVIKTATDTAILDKPVGEAFIDNLRNNAGTQLQALGSSHLGHEYQNENISYLGHKDGHFVLGIAAGALTDKPIEGAVEGIRDLVSREKGIGGFLDF